MLRIVTAGLTALFVTASPLAYAQTAASAATPSVGGLEHFDGHADRCRADGHKHDLAVGPRWLAPGLELALLIPVSLAFTIPI